jgi:photosystem II stability/assembly factor-like uncharacterized protein
MSTRNSCLAVLLLALFACEPSHAAEANAAAPNSVHHLPAVRAGYAMHSAILAVARSGERIVAVGDRGVVLISDDDGSTFRQADSVPTRATLTSVAFAPDGRTGWAVGHWGVVLVTEDGGSRWRMQRDDLSVDQPLFSVLFTDSNHGVAVGLWSLLACTADGGKTWTTSTLEAGASSGAGAKGSGRSLFSVFASNKGTLLVAAEAGGVYRSTNAGQSWTPVETGGKGSLWTGTSLKSGALLVGGLSGALYRSEDDGASWHAVTSASKSSITALAQAADGKVLAVGLNGVVLSSNDDGRSFQVARVLPDRAGIAAVIGNRKGTPLLFGEYGPIAGEAAGR